MKDFSTKNAYQRSSTMHLQQKTSRVSPTGEPTASSIPTPSKTTSTISNNFFIEILQTREIQLLTLMFVLKGLRQIDTSSESNFLSPLQWYNHVENIGTGRTNTPFASVQNLHWLFRYISSWTPWTWSSGTNHPLTRCRSPWGQQFG